MSKKFRKCSLFVIEHPNMDNGFIVSSMHEAEKLIKHNKKVWDQYDFDMRLFTISEYKVKDDKLAKAIKEGMPELFL